MNSENVAQSSLTEFDVQPERVLVVVAHPDDAEYGISAAVAKWSAAGSEVAYLLLTSGEAGMQRPPEEAGPLRAKEQQKACDIVGASRLTILDYADGLLEYSVALRKSIAREIRLFKPDVVVSSSGELHVPWGIDHADHRAAGLATIDAVRDADNRWLFRDLETEGLESWGASWLLLNGGKLSHYVAVTAEHETLAVASLAAHEAYLADLPWHPKPHDFIPGILRGGAEQTGANVDRAVNFQAIQLKSD